MSLSPPDALVIGAGPAGSTAARLLAQWGHQVGVTLQQDEIRRTIKTIEGNPRRFKADTIAKMLRVTEAERTTLKFTTIGCFDVSKAERKRRRKERRRLAEQRRRRAKGAIPRNQYLANSISRQQPWTVEGVSRPTWYRRKHL